MRTLEFEIKNEIIIKEFIKQNISKKFYRYLKRSNYTLFLNGKTTMSHFKAYSGDILRIEYVENNIEDTNYYPMDLDIIYEDDDFMVLYKPSGLKTIPTGYNDFKSLYNALLYYYKENNIKGTIHFINRLDKDTEGILLVAKNKITANIFSKDLNNIKRKYITQVTGIVCEDGKISLPIKKCDDSIKRIVSSDGKKSITNYKVLSHNNDSTFLEVSLETGRCHQIRVHMAYINHPIVGDVLYGSGNGLMLCSYCIKFKNPRNNKMMEFKRYPRWYSNEE